jgi:hypothetical protein
MPHTVYAAISGHGFGHLAQLAPVLNALRQRLPDLELIVQSALPAQHLRRHIDGSFSLIAEQTDVGLVMASALDVQVETTFAAYRAFHHNWPERVNAAAEQLRALGTNGVVADVPYLACAAGARAQLPTLALCSLNWADVFEHYCGALVGAESIHAEIEAAYNEADAFLRPAPAMPMSTLANTLPIGPIGRIGRPCRDRLARRLGLNANARLLMVSLGGIETRLPVEDWPEDPGLKFIVPASWGVVRADVIAFEDLGVSYLDAMCSCDALITKLGYGHVTDAACNAIPLLYVERGDWPEEPVLRDWLQRHGRCAPISRSELVRGDIAGPLAELLAQSPRPKVEASGVDQAVDVLMSRLA